jgi:tRNA-intron endonuclease, archaea type
VSGRLQSDATILISDPSEAGTVYGRGFFGTVSEPGLLLDRTEAVYLAEMGRISPTESDGKGVAWTEVYRRAVKIEPEFPVRYLVYRDLRQRGYVVRESPPPTRFAVLPRGGILHKTPARFWVQPLSEREPFDLGKLLPLFDRAHGARKSLLLGVVDEESDLTYYRVSGPTPEGARQPALPDGAAEALVTEDRVLVADPDAVERLGKVHGFGSRIGARLELSLVEAAFLGENGALRFRSAPTRRRMLLATLLRRADRVDEAFGIRLSAYRWLRERRLIVKTGFKYGAHFRAYVRDPEHAHARYLVQAAPSDVRLPWPSVAGHVRLAQGVRKEFLLAAVGPSGAVRCLALERIRP